MSSSDSRPVTDSIGQRTEKDNGQPEAPQTAAGDLAQLRLGESELASPIVQNTAADSEADAGGDQGDEAGQEQTSLAAARTLRRGVHGLSDFFGLLANSFDVDLLVAADGAEVQDQEQITQSHRQGHQ